MNHTLRDTPARQRYIDKFQVGGKTPAVVLEDHQGYMDDFERCRRLSLKLKQEIGQRAFDRFWASVPDGEATGEDIKKIERMLQLLEETGSPDKAMALFEQEQK